MTAACGLRRWEDFSRLKNGQLQNYTRPDEKSGIGEIMEDRTGNIWVTRYRVPPGEGPLCKVVGSGLQCYGKEDGVPVRYGLGLTEDNAGNIWFGSSVLCRWKPGSSATFFDDVLKDKVGDGVSDVKVGPDGTVWAAIDGTGPQLGVRQFKNGKWAALTVPGFDGQSIRGHALLVDHEGSLWIGASDGLYRIHNGAADHYGLADGLSGNSVGTLFEDRERNLWVITDGGIDMFHNTPVVTYTTQQGLTASDIQSIAATRDGSVLIGNDGAADVLRGGANHPLPAGHGLPGRISAAFTKITLAYCGSALITGSLPLPTTDGSGDQIDEWTTSGSPVHDLCDRRGRQSQHLGAG